MNGATIANDSALAYAGMLAGLNDSMRFAGIRVGINRLAERREPVNIHRRRRNQTENYHRRVQKKWVKRYGMCSVPCALVIDDTAIGGMLGRMLILHPQLSGRLKAL
jgi:hypothetical protein